MSIKEKDFVEIEYTGKTGGNIFDTTDEALAKEAGIFNPTAKYGSLIVCIGEKQLLPAMEEAMIGKEPSTFNLKLTAENAFGKKNAKLIQLIPTQKFLKANIRPGPGLQVNVDGAIGTVKTVSGGRTIVDFNHPLSGKDVEYDIKIKRIVTDDKEKVKSLLGMLTGKELDVEIKDGKTSVKLDLPPEGKEAIKKKVKDLTNIDVEYA
ncbi:MAG: peptidylprolyl isomerase [Candidatus Nanoarchaeia archaeon]